MPAFKPKPNKKICVNQQKIFTLDNKHNELLDEFYIDNTATIPDLRTKIKELLSDETSDPYETRERVQAIKKHIKHLRYKKKEYLLSNSKHIFDYFENKKEISNGNNKTVLLDQFFKLNNGSKKPSQDSTSAIKHYMQNIDPCYIDMANAVANASVCRACNIGELIYIDHEGLLVCNNCGVCTKSLVENEKPSYKEPPKEVCYYVYKRINHFREIIAQCQAKESTQIPEEILNNIRNQIKKERIDISEITNDRAKDILKKLGYNNCYEHIPFIKDKLGIKPPVMSQELEETLCNLFMQIQAPYSKFCPDGRVNFLNYYYTVYKLCELLEQTQFLPYFPMLKDREKRIEQDEIWKKICDDLEWEFIPTL